MEFGGLMTTKGNDSGIANDSDIVARKATQRLRGHRYVVRIVSISRESGERFVLKFVERIPLSYPQTANQFNRLWLSQAGFHGNCR